MNKFDCLGYETLIIGELSASFELENGVTMSPKRRSFLTDLFMLYKTFASKCLFSLV